MAYHRIEWDDRMQQTDPVESAICQKLALVGTCSMNLLTSQLSDYSWAEVFDAVTRLTRDGIVAIKHPGLCLYLPRSHPVIPRGALRRYRSESRASASHPRVMLLASGELYCPGAYSEATVNGQNQALWIRSGRSTDRHWADSTFDSLEIGSGGIAPHPVSARRNLC
jgi:hypothetical protein